MSEICPDCLNKISGKNRKKKTGSVLQEQYETLFLEFAKNANAK